jgi:hypothetical protein
MNTRNPTDAAEVRQKPFQKKGLVDDKAFDSLAYKAQNSLRPLFAAMRMRSALSLIKPAASAWL